MADNDKSKKGGKPQGGAPSPQGGKKVAKAPKAVKSAAPSGEKRSFARPKDYKPRMKALYEAKVRALMTEKFGYGNVMQVPRLEKIVLNMGVGDAVSDQKMLDAAMNELGQITGQRPALRLARKSISNFKLREGVGVGCCVTLRGARMYEFYDRLVNVAVPRIRDFRGLSQRSFDGRGNYSMGLTEQIIFPEINYDKVGKVRGMDVTIVTSAKTDEEGRELMRLMNMPFRQK